MIIQLEKIKNFRDLGGTPCADGKVLKKGLFLRGTGLCGASEHDIAVLRDEAHLRTLIDLRTSYERMEAPDGTYPGIRFEHMPIFKEDVIGVSHDRESDRKLEREDVLPDMLQIYRDMMNEHCITRFGDVVRRMLSAPDEEFGFLFHCTEGKDRTGIIAALLLEILGADRETIMADYTLTNEVNRHKSEAAYVRILRDKHNQALAERIREAFLAKEEYLQVLFDYIDECGGITPFMTEHLGIPLSLQAEARARFLEDA